MAEDTVAKAVERIEKWLEQTRTKESRLGLLACANSRAVQRVRDKSASIETLEAILKYIAANPAKDKRP